MASTNRRLPSSAVAECHRDSFNAAYTTLEQTIRNFSKEKLMYEQKIQGLKKDLENQTGRLEKLNLDKQKLATENKRILSMLDESEAVKLGVEATIHTVERKLEILSDTLEGFERVERDVVKRYKGHDEFIKCLKLRQIQLHDWIIEMTNTNKKLKLESEEKLKAGQIKYEEKVAELSAEIQGQAKMLDDMISQMADARNSFESEKVTFNKRIEELKLKVLEKEAELERDNSLNKAFLEETVTNMTLQHQAEVQKLNNQNQSCTKLLEDTRSQMEETRKSLEAEKEDLNRMIEDLKLKMEEKEAEFEREKLVQKTFLEETVLNMKSQHEAEIQKLEDEKQAWAKQAEERKIQMEETQKSFEAEREALVESMKDLQLKMEVTGAEFEREKLSQKTSFKETVTTLKAKHEEEVKKLNEQNQASSKLLDEIKHQMEEAQKGFQSEKESSNESFKQLRLKMEEREAEFEKERKLEKASLEETVANLKSQHQEQIKKLEGQNQASAKLLEELKSQMEESRKSFEAEKLALHENIKQLDLKMQERAAEVEKDNALQKSSFEETVTSLKSQHEEEMQKLKGENEACAKQLDEVRSQMEQSRKSFETEKENLGKDIEEMTTKLKNYSQCKANLRALYQRYQDQKAAIAKLVEDSGVRPIILPTSKGSGTRQTSFSATPSVSPYPVVAPVTPSKPVIPSRPEAVRNMPTIAAVPARSPRSILKRQDALDEKTKSVSFGTTTINNFIISSGSSDSETSSPNIKRSDTGSSESESDGSKRLKLDKESYSKDNSLYDSQPLQEIEPEKDTFGKGKENNEGDGDAGTVKSRRYFKKRIGQARPMSYH